MKLITKINQETWIVADEHQYAVRYQSGTKAKYAYFSNLSQAYEHVYDVLVRERLADDRDKSTAEVIEIIEKTRDEFIELFKRVSPKLSAS